MIRSMPNTAEFPALVAGDQGHAEEVPADLLRILYGQMRRLAGPRPDLDDLVQAAAERVLRAWPRFEGRSSVSTWTFGVVYRTLLDHDRWFRRWRRRFSETPEPYLPRDRPQPECEAALLELARARRLHQALAALPPKKRAVLVLCELEGLTRREVAEVVATNERTVRSRLRDAKLRLLQILRQDPLFDSEDSP